MKTTFASINLRTINQSAIATMLGKDEVICRLEIHVRITEQTESPWMDEIDGLSFGEFALKLQEFDPSLNKKDTPMNTLAEIYRFETRRFSVIVDALPEFEAVDVDDDGEAQEMVNNGELVQFCARCRVLCDGIEIGTDYLGQCIYKSYDEFRDNVGMRAGGYGSYFSDMIHEAIREARAKIEAFRNMPLKAA